MHAESEIIEIENKRADAILRHDLPLFYSLFAPEFVATNPYNKVVNKDQVFEIFKKGMAGNVSLFKMDIDKVFFVKELAIVMGLETLTPLGAALHANKTRKRRFTNIWIKNEDGWKITARQASIISINELN
jgi:ketosteroid isomerase-like protein